MSTAGSASPAAWDKTRTPTGPWKRRKACASESSRAAAADKKLQLETLQRLEPVLAFYMIVAWRVLFLTMLGRACPQMPCEVVFDQAEWQAVYIVTQRKPPPDTPPTLDQLVRMVAGLGGFLGRKSDGFPSPQTLWIGLQRAADFVLAMDAQRGVGEGRYGE